MLRLIPRLSSYFGAAPTLSPALSPALNPALTTIARGTSKQCNMAAPPLATVATQQRQIHTTPADEYYYIRKNYLTKMYRRDLKRRKLFEENEIERGCLRTIMKSDSLPPVIKMKAGEDLAAMPRDGAEIRINNRCVISDRKRGLIGRYRISRMEFREYADNGWIAGITRSSW